MKTEQKIIQGDCIEVMRGFADKSFDLVLTDPPYGVSLGYDSFDDSKKNVRELIEKFLPEALRVAKTVALTPGVRGINWYPKPTWILAWINRAGAGRSPWGFSCWQPIMVWGKDPFLAQSLGGRSDLIEDNSVGGDYAHPCPKPLSLMLKILDRVDHNGTGTILDPFLGSGTTLVACKQLGRNGIGIEISPAYCKIAEERLSATSYPMF